MQQREAHQWPEPRCHVLCGRRSPPRVTDAPSLLPVLTAGHGDLSDHASAPRWAPRPSPLLPEGEAARGGECSTALCWWQGRHLIGGG